LWAFGDVHTLPLGRMLLEQRRYHEDLRIGRSQLLSKVKLVEARSSDL
jgi:hypothetical protein